MGMIRTGISIGLVLLVVTLASATLLSQYLAITGTITILPSEEPDVNLPNHIADCLYNGWRQYTRLDGSSFENLGRCVSYVAVFMCKDESWQELTRLDGSSFENQGACVSYFVSGTPTPPSSWSPSTRGVSSSIVTSANVTVSDEKSIAPDDNVTDSNE